MRALELYSQPWDRGVMGCAHPERSRCRFYRATFLALLPQFVPVGSNLRSLYRYHRRDRLVLLRASD
jgi:hypothetical protein